MLKLFFFPPVQASFQRSNSHDKVRKIVAEEGRTARNLIAWSVPLENKEEEGRLLRAKQTVHICYYTSDSVFALRQILRHCISDSNCGTYKSINKGHIQILAEFRRTIQTTPVTGEHW